MTVIDPMGGIASGASTARVPVPADAADRARVAAARARARGNLAAIICDTWSVDLADPRRDDMALMSAAAEFAELADILGLGPAPERVPGHCACGATLPFTSASARNASDHNAGMCVVCTRKARAS